MAVNVHNSPIIQNLMDIINNYALSTKGYRTDNQTTALELLGASELEIKVNYHSCKKVNTVTVSTPFITYEGVQVLAEIRPGKVDVYLKVPEHGTTKVAYYENYNSSVI